MTMDHSSLLARFITQLSLAARKGVILDLACGSGRNGLYLVEQDIPVVFADINPEALARIERSLGGERYSGIEESATLWAVNFEGQQGDPFHERRFGGVIVYRYLHRPLCEWIKQSVYPGGIVIYETFTVDQPQYGRPSNPDFLLEHGELEAHFSDWDIVHSFEGVVKNSSGEGSQAIAQIVAIKDS